MMKFPYYARAFRFYPDPGKEKDWEPLLAGKKYKTVQIFHSFEIEFEQKQKWDTIIELLTPAGIIGINLQREEELQNEAIRVKTLEKDPEGNVISQVVATYAPDAGRKEQEEGK